MTPLWLQPSLPTAIFWLAYAICFLPEMIGSFFQMSSRQDRSHDRKSYPILVIGIIVSVVVGFNLAVRLPTAIIIDHPVPMLIIGSALIVAGALFRWYAIRVLGRFFTRDVAIRVDHQIIRTGPYRRLRHPSYAGGLLSMVGVAVALDNWPAFLVIIVINLLLYSYRISVEEAALTAQFGTAYQDYCCTTKRIIPFIF